MTTKTQITCLYAIIIILFLSVCALGSITYQQQNYLESISSIVRPQKPKARKSTLTLQKVEDHASDIESNLDDLTRRVDDLEDRLDEIDPPAYPSGTIPYSFR